MNFRKVLSQEDVSETPEELSRRRIIAGPTTDLDAILAEGSRFQAMNTAVPYRPDRATAAIPAKLRFFLNEQEEGFRYATQYLKDRYEFDGLMDKFDTTDILKILEQSVSLKYSRWEDASNYWSDEMAAEK